MKKLFIPAKIKEPLKKENLSLSENFPKKISIFYSIQYSNLAKQIKKILSNSYEILDYSQVLGCSSPNISEKTEAILLVSSGKFHGISLSYESGKKVYVFDNYKIKEILEKDVRDFKRKKKASKLNYLNSDNVGVLISTKPGQKRFERAIELKNKIRDKNLYFFVSNNFDLNQFENFPQIKSWINTACPRLDLDSSKVININDLPFPEED